MENNILTQTQPSPQWTNLLSPDLSPLQLIKILERLVLNKINPNILLSRSQHGFRPHHCTSTLLTNLTQNITEGFNQQKSAPIIPIAAIDISKTFDTFPRHILIQKFLNTDMHPNFKNGLPISFQADKHTQNTTANLLQQGTTQTESHIGLYSHPNF